MKKDKLKEVGRFVILWAIGLSIALLTSCVRVADCYYEDVLVCYPNIFGLEDCQYETREVCYY